MWIFYTLKHLPILVLTPFSPLKASEVRDQRQHNLCL
jgi:hypothetical protein